ncbi:MAG TPA: glycosyltransferase family 4 protein [Oleiagrimonas sp.]|nr:glycosyltransferase family 4 protein [Oleiagrimonas sp.]
MSSAGFDVVHVAETIRGGIATYLREIVPLQVTRFGADRVAVIVPHDEIGDLGRAGGAVLVGVPRAGSRVRMAMRVRGRLRRLLAANDTRILHVHSSFAGMSCRAPFFSGRVGAVVYCPHGWAFIRNGRSSRLAVSIERLLARRTDAIVCVSAAESDVAARCGLPASKLNVIRNALPDRRGNGPAGLGSAAADSPLRLLFLGRFDRAKGFDVLIDAARRLRRRIVLDVFGESVLGEYKEAGLPEGVCLHGWQPFPVMEPYLMACDAVVIPSRWEGLPMTAIEAMRAGKPVIGSHVPAIAEVIEDGRGGVLVSPDDASALALAIDTVSREDLAVMGHHARQRFLDEFRIEARESELADLYERVVA